MDEKPSLVPPVRRPLQASRRPVRMTPPHASGPKEERPPRWTSDQDAWAGPANRVSPPSHPNLRDSTGRAELRPEGRTRPPLRPRNRRTNPARPTSILQAGRHPPAAPSGQTDEPRWAAPESSAGRTFSMPPPAHGQKGRTKKREGLPSPLRPPARRRTHRLSNSAWASSSVRSATRVSFVPSPTC